MNPPNRTPKEPPICCCTGTTQTKIEQLIANGVNTMQGIANATGATTGCGSCDYEIMSLLTQHLAETGESTL
jgi:NAD(P)H-nitrite reductase large subunit